MAITAVAFTNGAVGSATSATTASKTWTSSRVYLITVLSFISGGTPVAPTVTGSTQHDSLPSPVTTVRLSLFRFLGDGTTGTKTIDFSGVTQTEIQWTISELTGTVTTGTNASGAIVNEVSGTGSSTTITETLPAFLDATNNATWFFGYNQGGAAMTVKAGFTALSSNAAFFALEDEYKVGQDTTPNFTMGSSTSWVGIAAEIAAAGGGGGGRTFFVQPGLDGHSIAGPKQFNPTLYHRHPAISLEAYRREQARKHRAFLTKVRAA